MLLLMFFNITGKNKTECFFVGKRLSAMQLICEDFQVPLGVLGIIFEARPDAAVQVAPTRWHSLPNVATGNDEHAFLESRYSEPRDDRNSEPNPAARPGTIEPFCRR